MELTFDQAAELLDEMAEQFPPVFFDELNGGILLEEEAKCDPMFPEGEVYFMGEYIFTSRRLSVSFAFPVMSKTYSRCIFSALPSSSPLRKISAMVSIPWNFNSSVSAESISSVSGKRRS